MTNAEFCRKQRELIDEGQRILFSVISTTLGKGVPHEETVYFAEKDENGKPYRESEKLDFKELESSRVLIIDIQSINNCLDNALDSACFDIMLKSKPEDWLSVVSAYNFCCLREKIITSISNGEQSVEIDEFFNKEYYKDGKTITQEKLQTSLLKYFEVIAEDEKTIVIKFNG